MNALQDLRAAGANGTAYLVATLQEVVRRSPRLFGKLSIDRTLLADLIARLQREMPATDDGSGAVPTAVLALKQLLATSKPNALGSIFVDEEVFADIMSALQSGEGSSAPHRVRRLVCDDTLLFIVDVQERLLPAMHGAEQVERNCALLARAARQLDIPILLTEQNPARLGRTVDSIAAVAMQVAMPKMRFSACTEQTRTALAATGRRTVLLCGIEAHVCVLQSALDLLDLGYTVFVPDDAIASRQAANQQVAGERLRLAGALPTSAESAIFELLQEAGTPNFKALLPFIK